MSFNVPARFGRRDPRTLEIGARFRALVRRGDRLTASLGRFRPGCRRRDLTEWHLSVVEVELALSRMALREFVEDLADKSEPA